MHGNVVNVLDKPTIVQGVCERASKSQVCADSILILHLICTGMDSRGALPFLLKTTLEDYHTTESLVYEELTFNLGTDTKLSRWRDTVRKLGTRLNAHKFARKIIFVTVHSDLTRGDLFAGKDENEGDVSAEVEDVSIKSICLHVSLICGQFMTCLFSSPLEDIVHASTLFMLTCGPLVTFQESFLKLKTSISR